MDSGWVSTALREMSSVHHAHGKLESFFYTLSSFPSPSTLNGCSPVRTWQNSISSTAIFDVLRCGFEVVARVIKPSRRLSAMLLQPGARRRRQGRLTSGLAAKAKVSGLAQGEDTDETPQCRRVSWRKTRR